MQYPDVSGEPPMAPKGTLWEQLSLKHRFCVVYPIWEVAGIPSEAGDPDNPASCTPRWNKKASQSLWCSRVWEVMLEHLHCLVQMHSFTHFNEHHTLQLLESPSCSDLEKKLSGAVFPWRTCSATGCRILSGRDNLLSAVEQGQSRFVSPIRWCTTTPRIC